MNTIYVDEYFTKEEIDLIIDALRYYSICYLARYRKADILIDTFKYYQRQFDTMTQHNKDIVSS